MSSRTLTKILVSIYMFSILALFNSVVSALRVGVIGASGGIGQLVCSQFVENGVDVTAIGRSKAKLQELGLLKGCKIVENDLSSPAKVAADMNEVDYLVVSVGTTAFPTKAWSNNNNPRNACYNSVKNLLLGVELMKNRPSSIVLVTSIGVDRRSTPPFSILNLFDVLTEKKNSEDLLIEKCLKMSIRPIICRPGRLIGAPYTNLDLAKLLKIKNSTKRGVLMSMEDILNGDVDREDVARSIMMLPSLLENSKNDPVIYSIVNVDGPIIDSSLFQWKNVFSKVLL